MLSALLRLAIVGLTMSNTACASNSRDTTLTGFQDAAEALDHLSPLGEAPPQQSF